MLPSVPATDRAAVRLLAWLADLKRAANPARQTAESLPSTHDLRGERSAAQTPVPTRIGDYRLLAPLAQGGMGVVYRAVDERLGRPVAIKLIRPDLTNDPELGRRLAAEARALAAIDSPYVVPLWAAGDVAGRPYLVMPLLRGETLAARLEREPVSPAALIHRVARDLARGLADVHAAGYVHRDVKPANVWLDGPAKGRNGLGRVRRSRLLDLGVALSRSGRVGCEHSDAVVGTPGYLAPEQARGWPVDGRADLFALGCVLFRMAAGVDPFPGGTPLAAVTALAAIEPPPVRALQPRLPVALARVIDALLEKDPERRPASAARVLAMLGPRVPPAAPVDPDPPEPEVLVLTLVKTEGPPRRPPRIAARQGALRLLVLGIGVAGSIAGRDVRAAEHPTRTIRCEWAAGKPVGSA